MISLGKEVPRFGKCSDCGHQINDEKAFIIHGTGSANGVQKDSVTLELHIHCARGLADDLVREVR